MSRARLSLGVAVSLLLWGSASVAQQADAGPAEVMLSGNAALSRGAPREAIEIFESFADRGGLHPDVSYDRGVAYLARAREGGGLPGDLGRAAAAFEESLWLRPDDPGAEAALEAVRAEVARKRARGDQPMEVVVKPSPLRAILGLASEQAWAVCALASTMLVAAGLVLARGKAQASRVAGGVAAALGLLGSLCFVPLTAAARSIRRDTAAAVVVVPEATLVDERGVSVGKQAIPEAARVEVQERKGALVKVTWGELEGYTAALNVRVVRPAEGGGI